MRIKMLHLVWFRGAADSVSLDLDSKSMLIYGANAAGKSSFVDAVEFFIGDGRINHLAHEHSGKYQEKGIPNTHTPNDATTELKVKFQDDSERTATISKSGVHTFAGADHAGIEHWDYRRTILRQDEVAAFIQSTKGEKYSAILPLLGLHDLEIAAENVRKLTSTINTESKLIQLEAKLFEIAQRRANAFGEDSDKEIKEDIFAFYKEYCAKDGSATDPVEQCTKTIASIDAKIASHSAEIRTYAAIQAVAAIDVKSCVDGVRTTTATLASASEPMITEIVAILGTAKTFAENLDGEGDVNCPACGRPIPIAEFRAHVEEESKRLKEVIDASRARATAMGVLSDIIKRLQTDIQSKDLDTWRQSLDENVDPQANWKHVEDLDGESLRQKCDEDTIKGIEDSAYPLISVAKEMSKGAPREAKQLADDKQTAMEAKEALSAGDIEAEKTRAQSLVNFLEALEECIRMEIRDRSTKVISEITHDIQEMWKVLHPGEQIEGVRLSVPTDSDKAIDIALKFYGKEQDSPRLTLSEGVRNSLGLCIFLAMAIREAEHDRPLILDDVVISLDRNHRGMVFLLLEEKFANRQVILLTHDRDWYSELRRQLKQAEWKCRMLKPYEDPTTGIQWSHKTNVFDDARAHLKERPDSACNDARKIMDTDLSIIAERLELRMPYLRGDKNDMRHTHDFMLRILADARRCYRIKQGESHVVHESALAVLDRVRPLLETWANIGSHRFDGTTSEAAKLIDNCEQALEVFDCDKCGRSVWFANVESKRWKQCECGRLQWQYGRA